MRRLILPFLFVGVVSAACHTAGTEVSEDPVAVHVTQLTSETLPGDGEVMWLRVEVGALPSAAALVLRDGDGHRLGTISPFGKSVRQAGGSHLVPLPEALQRRRVVVHAEMALADGTLRPPTAAELVAMRLVLVETKD